MTTPFTPYVPIQSEYTPCWYGHLSVVGLPEPEHGFSVFELERDRGDELEEREELTLREALAAAEREKGPDSRKTGEAALALAAVLYRLSRYRDSRSLARRGWRILEKALGPERPETLKAAAGYACGTAMCDQPGQAFQIQAAVRESRRRILGPLNPATLAVTNDLGVTLVQMDKVPKAYPLFKEAADGFAKALRPPPAARRQRTRGRLGPHRAVRAFRAFRAFRGMLKENPGGQFLMILKGSIGLQSFSGDMVTSWPPGAVRPAGTSISSSCGRGGTPPKSVLAVSRKRDFPKRLGLDRKKAFPAPGLTGLNRNRALST